MQLLGSYLKHNGTDQALVELIETLMVACKEIALQLREGALAGIPWQHRKHQRAGGNPEEAGCDLQ